MVLVCLLAMWGLVGVASGATGHAFVASLGEAPAGRALGEPTALAVDHATGDLFVADRGRGVVDVFGATGSFLMHFGGFVEANGLAVDEATGDVYLTEPFEDAVLV